jgi:hypothetical protein
MSIIAASEHPLSKLKVASFDLNCLAIYQSIGQLFPSRFQYPMEGRPGDPHLLGTLFLFQLLRVLKANRFKFLK